MSYDPKTRLWRCDACSRAQNDHAVLMTMYGPETGDVMRICGAAGCTKKANERGYYSGSQDRPATS